MNKVLRVIDKPWGKEEILEENKAYVIKKIYIDENARTSLQYHREKTETLFVFEGTLYLYNDKLKLTEVLLPGDYKTVPPGLLHRLSSYSAGVTAPVVVLECSSPELDDVVRLEDDYGRVSNG
jgi:mannose-6-phosphate isomerase